MRCADGSCSRSAVDCPASDSLCDVAGEVPCGDGVTCAADAKACRAAVQLDGCPVGQLACPSNPKECRADTKNCRCTVAGEQFCGWQRDEKGRLMRRESLSLSTGEVVLQKVARCAVRCGGGGVSPLAVEVKPVAMAVDPLKGSSAALEAPSHPGEDGSALSGNRTIGAVRIPKGAVTAVDDVAGAVAFAIKPVALADVQQGSFGKLERMSTAVTMVPDRVITIDGDIGIEFDLCIGDDEAQTNATKCNAVLARLRPVSSQDVSAAESDAAEVLGGCRKGTACGCSCAFATPHLTSFMVADPGMEVAGEITADQMDAGLEVQVLEEGGAGPPQQIFGVASGGDLRVVPIVIAVVAVVALAAGAKWGRQACRTGSSEPGEGAVTSKDGTKLVPQGIRAVV